MFLSIILLTSSTLMDCVLDSALHDIWVSTVQTPSSPSFHEKSLLWSWSCKYNLLYKFDRWTLELFTLRSCHLALGQEEPILDVGYYIHYCGLCHWPKCYRIFNWFFLPKPGFWNLFEFSVTEITLKWISPIFRIQILPNNFHWILLIKIFPTTWKAHSDSSKIFSYDLIWFSVKKSFNI